MVHDHKIETANKRIRAVTNLSIEANVLLSVLKVIVGLVAGSMALVADGFHSLSDMLTDFAVLLGVRLGSKAPDPEHPYGHGRAETFAAALIALILILIGAATIYYAAIDIVKAHVAVPGAAVLIVAVISIIIKELIYRFTKKVAVESHSSVLYANAWHHRTDALSSVAVVIGFASLKLGFAYGDQIAAIAVGLMITLVGIKVVGDCFQELTEAAVDSETVDQIKRIIASEKRIHNFHRLRTRTVGREVFLDLHILVGPDLTIIAAHEIAETLETTLHKQLPRPVNITVHIEPDIPPLRK